MIITQKIYNNILHTMPLVPPETGGIIGGQRKIITCYELDSGSEDSNGYEIYAPDVDFINQTIDKWCKENIKFYGLFHSHFPRETVLSPSDRRYIERIMHSLPAMIRELYFPIIFPRETIIAYRATRIRQKIKISPDRIEII